jgi:hypothetical protein
MDPSPPHSDPNGIDAVVEEMLPRLLGFFVAGQVSRTQFEEQIRQLSKRRFQPRGLMLQIKHVTASHARFLIVASRSGVLCHTIDFDIQLRRTEEAA